MSKYGVKKFNVLIPTLCGNGIHKTIETDVLYKNDDNTKTLLSQSMELIEKIQAKESKLLSTNEIKQLRKQLGLSQEKISSLLQLGGKTWSRWENGRWKPTRSMNVILLALRDGMLTLSYLESIL